MPFTRLAVATLALSCLATASFADPPTTSPTDTAAQLQNEGPRGPLLRWIQGLYDGDATVIAASFWFSDSKHKDFALLQWQSQVAEQHLRKALDKAFGPQEDSPLDALNEYKSNLHHSTLGITANIVEDQKNEIIHADLSEQADSAILALGRRHPFQVNLVKINGEWKIDHNKTFPSTHDSSPAEIAALKNYITDTDTAAAEVNAKKYPTRDDAWKRYDPIWQTYTAAIAAAKPRSTQPPAATSPAPQPDNSPKANSQIQITSDSGPRNPLFHWIEGIYLCDQKLAEAAFVFSDEKTAAIAKARIETRIAEQRLRLALEDKFGREPIPNPTTDPDAYKKYLPHSMLGMIKPVAQFDIHNIASADLKQTGDSAILATPNDLFYLIKINGEWKIDFNKTQPENGSFTPEQLAAWQTWRDSVNALADDVNAGKFKTRPDVWDRYDALTGNAMRLSGKLP